LHPADALVNPVWIINGHPFGLPSANDTQAGAPPRHRQFWRTFIIRGIAMSREKELILKMELLPSHVRGQSINDALGSYRWKKVRADLIAERGLRCKICDEVPERKGYLHAHEVWEHSAKGSKLIDIRLLCWFCHACQHYDMYVAGGIQGLRPDTPQRIKAHYCRVNGVSESVFDADYKRAIRTAFAVNIPGVPEIDYGTYSPLLQKRRAAQQEWRDKQLDDDSCDDGTSRCFPTMSIPRRRRCGATHLAKDQWRISGSSLLP
jgi:hypothetical protein